jgi:hypothetical protein
MEWEGRVSTAKITGVLVAGVAIGGWVGWTAQALTAEKPREIPRSAVAQTTMRTPGVDEARSQLPAPVAPSEDLAATERAARLAAEKERDALKAELAALKSGSTTAAESMKGWRWGKNGWTQEPREKLAKLEGDAATKRLATIGADVDAQLAKLDAEKASDLLRELARLGRPAWPLIDRLVTAKPAPHEQQPAADEDEDPNAQDAKNF